MISMQGKYFRIAVLSVILASLSSLLTGQTVTETFTSSGNFTVPAGVGQITVEAWGGGGGTRNDGTDRRGGGGGGAYASSILIVTPGESYSVTVGSGGSAANPGQAGGNSSFGASVVAAGGAGGTNNGGAGGSIAASTGDVRYAGGNGSNRGNPNGGGGGGSAFPNANGNNGAVTAGGTGTGNGGNGGTNGQSGNNGFLPGGGGGGRGSNGLSAGEGANGQVLITYTQANYLARFTAMDIGSLTWISGETRTVSVTITNAGLSAWTNAAPDINIGVKWNADPDYLVRVDANNLAPGESRTYNLNVTAPATPGLNNLTFDVVNEGNCWFGNNNGSCGPGNAVYTSPALTITTAYYSQNSGNPGTLANWNSNPLGGGSQPVNFTANNQLFIVQNGDNMSTTGNWTVSGTGSGVVIGNGASIINTNHTLTLGSFVVEDGGAYTHARNGGTIPTATWGASSNCNVTGITNTAPGGINQNFGNFTWNCTAQGTNNIDVAFSNGTTFQGNFTVSATGTTGSIRLSNNTTKSMTITGDLVINGGVLNLLYGGNDRTQTLNVAGNFTMTGGSLTETNTNGGSEGSIIFNGTTPQTYTKTGGTISNTVYFTVNSGAILDFGTSEIDGGNGTFTLNSGATIITGHNEGLAAAGASGSIQVTGTRNFNAGAYYIYNGTVAQVTGDGLPATISGGLTINNTSGVTLSRTTTVSGVYTPEAGPLNISSNYTFTLSGTVSCGTSGSIYATNGTVVYDTPASNIVQGTYYNLSLTGGGTAVLCNHAAVSNTLNLNTRVLQLGNNNLTITNTLASAITGTFGASNMIETNGTGSLIKHTNTNDGLATTYPIGSGGAYTPVQINSFSATAIAPASTLSLRSSATAAPGVPGTHPLNRHWVTATSGITGSVLADISFGYAGGDIPAGGTATLYEIFYETVSDGWNSPNGASAAGANPLRATAATSLDATWTATEPEKRIFYSLKTGNWDDPTTWTLDPSGTQPLNPNNVTPTTSITSTYDEVVILSGRTVTVNTNDKVNRKLTVTGTLDLGSTTGHSFNTILGTGRIRLAADNFPAGDATDFITAGQGEGTVEYYGNTRNLTISRTFFNVDVNMSAANTLTLLTDYNINGNLTVTNGIFSINNSSNTTALNINLYGNLTVASAGNIITGTANARHQLNLYGNFTNNGTVRFTNRAAADYTSEATDGIVDANFLSADRNQSILCRGTTNFYRIEIDKGTDYTYNLDIDASASSNFNLFGFANENHAADVPQLADNNNALGLVRGSVRIGNSITISSLSVADVYCISEGAQLWVDRGQVQKNSGQNIAIYGKIKITNGTLEARTASGITFRNNGILSVEGGTVYANQIRSSDIGTGNYGSYIQTAGSVNVTGGTINTDYYVFSLPYPASVFNMSGGTLTVNTAAGNGGVLINSDAENVKVTGGTVIAETNAAENFRITSTAPFWNFSMKNASGASRQFLLDAAADIGPDNVDVPAQPLKVLNDLRLWGQESGGGSYPAITFNPGANDVYIGGSFYIENGALYLPISGGTYPYDAIASQPASRNTTWFNKTAGTAMVEEFYQGNATLPLEIGNLVVDRTSGYELRTTSAATRTNETVVVDVNGNASVLSGNLNQHLYTIRTWGAITNNGRMGTWYPGITPSRAQIQLVENPSLTLTTSSDAVFGNVQINVTPPSVLTLSSDVYIERMEYVQGLIYLKGYNLKLDNLWNMPTGLFENSTVNSYLRVTNNGYSGNSMIFTDGKASDGGLTLKITANSQAENQPNILNNVGPTTFPVGFTPNGGTTLYFRPAQMVVKNYSGAGYITVRPVLGSLQTTNLTGGEVLQHYWRVSHSGFSAVPTVAYRFYYRNQIGVANLDLPTGSVNEALYVPGKVLDESPYTRLYEPLAENDIVRSFGAGGNSRFITFNGTSTNGLFSPAAAGITLENANYSTGQAARFTGSVLIYYSIDNNNVDGNNGTAWNRAASWTRSDILNTTLTSPHNSAQPRSTTIPGAGDVVVIGWVPWDDAKVAVRGQPHCIWLTDTRQIAEVVFTRMTNASGNPVPRFYRSNFQFRPTLTINGNGDNNTYDNDGLADNGRLTAKLVKGEGLFWNRQSDPDYTIMDIGDFAREDSSYVIYENFTNNRVINNTPPLFPNIYISNDGWGGNDHSFTFSRDIVTTGNIELLGDVNLLLPTGATGNLTAGRNLVMFQYGTSGGGARIDFQNTDTARKVIVNGDLLMKNGGSVIQVITPDGAPLDHELHIHGNIVQGTSTLSSTGLNLWTANNMDRITLYLDGNNSMTYTLNNGTIPDLYRMVVNKGNSVATTAQFNCDFDLNGPTSGAGVAKALELQNGLFIVNNAGVGLNLTTGNDHFPIPATAGLEMRLGTANATGTSGIALDGLLRVSGGTVDMAGGDNPIEYSASGVAAIQVTGGALTVGGQIRRSLTSDGGILVYNQTGGTVIAGNNAATYGNRGVFEIMNPGSSFTMTGGNLYIARAQTSPTISAFYFNPATVNISNAANIHIGHNTTPAAQTIGIYAGQPLPRLRVNNTSGNNPVARLEVVPATITSLLLIDANSTFNANGLDLTLTGDMTATGTFVPNGNTTFISGTGNQTITGNGSPLNFYNLDKTHSNNLLLNTGNTPLLISNNLLLRNGTFTDNGNTINVKGDALNDATHVNNGAGDGVLMNGTLVQELTGNGIFGKLTINNPGGVNIPVGNQLLITRSLKMQSGVLNIGRNLLDIGLNAVIEEASPFSAENMIETNISFTDNGLRKTFPAGASPVFTYPMGSGGKYTPVRLTISANGNSTGSITVKPANEIHPSIVEDTETTTQIIDKDNALQYYWTLKSSGISGFSAVARMRYDNADISVGPEYTIADYHTASLLLNGSGNWLKFPQADFDETNRDLVFNYSNTTDTEISGDYTAGAGDASLNGAIPDQVLEFETNNNGNWTTGTIWTPNISGGPRGAIARINAAHTVDVTTNYLAGYMTEIYGTLRLYSTFGHRLGIVNGTGTMVLEVGDIPAAVYDNFFSSAGGTLQFNGTSSYEFLGNITEVNNLTLSGSGERRFPNNELTLNGNLAISGGAGLSVINYYNRQINIEGDLIRTGGAFDAGSGANATLVFNGTLPQTITGSFSNTNSLNNLEVNNVNDITIVNDVEIDGVLRLTNGLINTSPGSLFRINYGATVSPSAGSALSFINGVCTKELINGNSFTFPIGNFSDTKAHGPITLQTVTGPSGINDWKASYFYANATLSGYNTESFEAPISTVSHSEYWKIEAPTGGASVIRITLDGSSDVASSLLDLSNLRVVGWNATDGEWEVVGTGATVSGTATSGTITTTAPVNYGSYTYFTLASVTPVAASTATITSPSVVNLCNGQSTTIVVTFTGDMPYVLTYTAGATSYTTGAINAVSYSITVTPSLTTVYTLTGVTANGIPGTITGITSATVNVSPIPTVLLSSSPVSPVCEGTSITFTATAGLTNYRFRVNGTTVQNGSGNTYTTNTLGVGIQSIDVIGTNTGGCSATSSAISMTVNPRPSAAGAISGPASVCLEASATYTVPVIANATSYTWSATNGATGTSSTNSINLTFPNSGTSVITVYGVNACGNGVSSSLNVAVSTASTPGAAGAITGFSEVCEGGTGYGFSVGAVSNATSYIWNFTGTGITVNGTGNSVTLDIAAGATSGNLTVAGTNGCATGTASPVFPVTVHTRPTATISPASPSTCSGTPITLTASPSGGTAPYATHAWTGTGAGSLSSTAVINPSFNTSIGGSYDLTYTVTDAEGCTGSANTIVTVFQAPIADAGPDALDLCTGVSPIVMTGATASGSYSGTPTWTGLNGSWTQNPDPSLATFTPSATSGSTVATLTLTGANGCSSVSDTRSISWSMAPVQPAVFTASSSVVCQGQTGVVFTVPLDPMAVSYNWTYTIGTGATITGTGNSIVVDFSSAATSGRINVTATNSCGTSTSRTLDITVNPTPNPSLLTTDIETCTEGTEVYTVTNNAAWTYTWSVENNEGTITGSGNSVTIDWLDNSVIFTGALANATSVLRTVSVVVRTNPDNGCSSTLEWDVTVLRCPETGPAYRIPNE